MKINNKRILKKMGYLSDQEGIMRRYLREMEGWNDHFKKTKRFILNRTKKMDFNSIAFLGSGWLLDIPVAELIESGKTLYLYDIRHPKQIIHKTSKQPNLVLHETDLTGGLIHRYDALLNKYPKEEVHLHLMQETKNADYPDIMGDVVVSLNIMDQLDGLLVDYLKQRLNLSNAFWMDIRKQIQHNHLKLLKKHRSLLITDLEELVHNDRESTTNPLVLTKLPQSKHQEKWQWKFDSTGSYHKNKKTTFNVIALEL